MLSFLARFASLVRGVLCGFDRLFFTGTLRGIAHISGLKHYLWVNRICYKDFANHSLDVTARLEEASLRQARQQGREIIYLNSAQHCKEDIARAIAARKHIKSGLICVLRSVDPCMSFQVNSNRQTRKLEIHHRQRKCLHLYHYQIHPVFGFMHARIQTWFPFCVYVCINGREWLARQMDQAKFHYLRRDNTFTWLEDVAQAQALFNQQLLANWPSLLDGLAATVNPAHDDIFATFPCRYYWSATDTEWASDVMFANRASLQQVYRPLLRYAVTTFDTVNVMRFLGQPVPASGKVPHRHRHEVSCNLTERIEGVRLKHWLNGNSIKMYDKGSVLRVETLIRDPGDFKVFRPAEGNPDGPMDWRPLRKGIADLHRRAEVSQAANSRYLQALSAVQDKRELRELVEPLCSPTMEPARQRPVTPAPAEAAPAEAVPAEDSTTPQQDQDTATKVRPRRVRALNPLAKQDAALLEAISRHEFMINGLRNRDLRQVLFGPKPADASAYRRQAAKVTRLLRLLRGHGLIQKVPRTHRYLINETARAAITTLLAARNASADALVACAA
jgi:hypothetical protein